MEATIRRDCRRDIGCAAERAHHPANSALHANLQIWPACHSATYHAAISLNPARLISKCCLQIARATFTAPTTPPPTLRRHRCADGSRHDDTTTRGHAALAAARIRHASPRGFARHALRRAARPSAQPRRRAGDMRPHTPATARP